MTRLERRLRAIAEQLRKLQVPFALVGGLAVSARSEPRFTRDADLAVAVESDQHAESVVRSLFASGYSSLAFLEQEAAGRLAVARLRPPGEPARGGIVVDLLFASSGIEREVVEQAQTLEVLPNLLLPVAQAGHLVALKLLSAADERPQDRADLLALAKVCDESDFEIAREGVELIQERGFARNRDLTADLLKLVRK